MIDETAAVTAGPSRRAPGLFARLSGYVANALRFWEPCRGLYNAALLLVVAIHFVAEWPQSWQHLSLNLFLVLFFFAVLANICYCGVYAVDLFVQFSGLQQPWRVARWVVLAVGTAFAGTITHFVSSNVFTVGA